MGLSGQAAEAFAFAPEQLDTIVAAEIAQWGTDQQAEVTSWRTMPDDAIPVDRAFRTAWCDTTPDLVIDIDMPKARDIHRERLRALRAPLLAALDVEMTRAYRDPSKQDEIEAERQVLRDVTADKEIEAATTPEELKAVLPAVLKV